MLSRQLNPFSTALKLNLLSVSDLRKTRHTFSIRWGAGVEYVLPRDDIGPCRSLFCYPWADDSSARAGRLHDRLREASSRIKVSWMSTPSSQVVGMRFSLRLPVNPPPPLKWFIPRIHSW